MTDQEQEPWQEPWPEKMYLLHPSIKTFGAMVSNPERREYVRADRIEELENSLAWYQMMDAMSSDHVVELTDKLEAAEAKLTKAVEALRNILSGDDLYPWRIAREVLVELEGK